MQRYAILFKRTSRTPLAFESISAVDYDPKLADLPTVSIQVGDYMLCMTLDQWNEVKTDIDRLVADDAGR